MMYGPSEVAADLTAVARGGASFEARARLEHHLLLLLQGSRREAVAELLELLSDHGVRVTEEAASAGEGRFIATIAGAPDLVISTFRNDHSASVNVAPIEGPRPPQDPRHKAFYDVWESLLGISESDAARLEGVRRTVFLIGLLEAEVMNGGLGQYLTNTDGAHLDETLQCLVALGAGAAASMLDKAGTIGKQADSFVDAWVRRSDDLQKLDQGWLDEAEDLAGLVGALVLQDLGKSDPGGESP